VNNSLSFVSGFQGRHGSYSFFSLGRDTVQSGTHTAAVCSPKRCQPIIRIHSVITKTTITFNHQVWRAKETGQCSQNAHYTLTRRHCFSASTVYFNHHKAITSQVSGILLLPSWESSYSLVACIVSPLVKAMRARLYYSPSTRLHPRHDILL